MVSTVFFHKDEGANVAVTNCMSHFPMFFPTKATVKLANENTGYTQVIGNILFLFPTSSIIYPVALVGTNIGKCDMQFVTATLAPPSL